MNKFSFETIKDFDKHIKDSIPNYDLMTEGVMSLSKYFIDRTAQVVDLGCSTGRMLEAIDHNGSKVGIDISENLLPKSHGNTRYVQDDLNEGFLYTNNCLVLAIFTLQFLRYDSRKRLIEQVYDSLIKGGGFIVAEKVYSEDSRLQEMMTFSLYDYKSKTFTPKEILEKENSIRDIMKPNTSDENQKLMKEAGFNKKQLFWKFYHFEAWIYIK